MSIRKVTIASRVINGDNDRRDTEDLPQQETACAVRAVLRQQIGLPTLDLGRETANIMGYRRLGSSVEQAMLMGIDYAVKKGWAEYKDGRLFISE